MESVILIAVASVVLGGLILLLTKSPEKQKSLNLEEIFELDKEKEKDNKK